MATVTWWPTITNSTTINIPNGTWLEWNQHYWVTTSVTTSAIWTAWNNDYRWPVTAVWNEPVALTAEAVAAQQAARVEQEQRRTLATATARALLESVLDESQLRDLAQRQFFDVLARSGRRYRIHTGRGYAGNVRLLDGEHEVASLCAHLSGTEPTADSFIAQKLALEDDEEGFLAVANVSRLASGVQLPRPERTARLRAVA